jgi:hypothetical protein
MFRWSPWSPVLNGVFTPNPLSNTLGRQQNTTRPHNFAVPALQTNNIAREERGLQNASPSATDRLRLLSATFDPVGMAHEVTLVMRAMVKLSETAMKHDENAK